MDEAPAEHRLMPLDANADHIPRPTLGDVGVALGPTRNLPPGAWPNTCRGMMVYYTMVLGRTDVIYLEPAVAEHPTESRRPLVRLIVATRREGGLST